MRKYEIEVWLVKDKVPEDYKTVLLIPQDGLYWVSVYKRDNEWLTVRGGTYEVLPDDMWFYTPEDIF